MRAIKAIVIFMGLLLVAGLGLLGYGLYSKAGKLSKAPADQTAAAPAAAPVASSGAAPEAASADAGRGAFGEQTVTLPPGSRVETMSSTASRVILHVAGPQGSRLVVVDPVTGGVTGTLILTPEGASGAAQQGGGAAR